MKIGWVLQSKENKKFMDVTWSGTNVGLKDAYVFANRSGARADKLYYETVRKVSLTKNGRAKKIIGRG